MAVQAAEGWVENRPTSGARAIDLHELSSYRELIFFLALRDLKAKYKQAFFGAGWALVQPIVGVAIFTVVFRHVANVPSQGIPYLAFALLGLLVWSYFSTSVNGATLSLLSNATLLTKVYFPRIVAPLAALLPGLVDFAIGLVLLALVMGYYGIVPSAAIFALPLCLLAATAIALGAGLLLSALNVKYRDVGAVLGLVMQTWLLASPVAYPSSLVGGGWHWLYALNPMVGVVDSFRWAVLSAPAPGLDLLASLGAALVLLIGGLQYFQRTERQFADVV